MLENDRIFAMLNKTYVIHMLEELVDKEVAIGHVSIARMREAAARKFVHWVAQIRTVHVNFHFLRIMHVTAQKYHAPTAKIRPRYQSD